MTTTNASIGRKGEEVFRDSLRTHPRVIEILKDTYGIQGEFSTTMLTGTGQKCDVKIGFDCGRNIDASIKTYKDEAGYNQLTRLTVDNFAIRYSLSDDVREELRELILEKSRVSNRIPLFPKDRQKTFKAAFKPSCEKIIKESFSDVPGREILVLFNRTKRTMQIWRMTDVVRKIPKTLGYTQGGNMILGGCIALQRKGGNGKSVIMDKTSPQHPGNQVQIKLHIKKFIDFHHQRMLAEYQV